MENALWGADKVDSEEEPINHPFVTAMVKGDTGPAPGHWAIKGADATAGALKTYWDGHRAPKYAPMKKQVATTATAPSELSVSIAQQYSTGVFECCLLSLWRAPILLKLAGVCSSLQTKV
jgi:hypothetical protein